MAFPVRFGPFDSTRKNQTLLHIRSYAKRYLGSLPRGIQAYLTLPYTMAAPQRT
jgi:hypothetical protein